MVGPARRQYYFVAYSQWMSNIGNRESRYDKTGAELVQAIVPTKQARIFAWFTGVTAVAILVQAILAGMFVSQDGRDGWITVHGVVADVSWVLALISAFVAWRTLRNLRPELVRWSSVLFVITLAQSGIGHLITDKGQDNLIAVHVPLAFVVFGLTIWLTMQAVALRRASSAAQ
jgi:hypothetical protein